MYDCIKKESVALGELMKYTIRKGVDSKMRGEVLEFEIDKAIDKAVDKARVETLYTTMGLSPEKIAEKLNFSIEKVNKILAELKSFSA